MSNGRDFRELLEAKWDEKKFLCVGLDTDITKIPQSVQEKDTRATMVAFNRAIVDATKDLVCAYKPNLAFYIVRGGEGMDALRETIMYIREAAPEVMVLLDAKFGDIEHTNEQYAQTAFEYLQSDAVTVQPYAGGASLAPFYERTDKGVFVWCKSSNGGGGEFQDMNADGPSTELRAGEPFYKTVARHVKDWNKNGNSGVVVGGTYPKELGEVRKIVGDMPILIPGIGAQDGSLSKTIENGLTSDKKGLIVNASRSIIYASLGDDFADVARTKAQELHDAITKAL